MPGNFLVTGCPTHITIWEKVEKHAQRGRMKSKQASPHPQPCVQKPPTSKGHMSGGEKGKMHSSKREHVRMSGNILSLVFPFHESRQKGSTPFSLRHPTESLQACTPTFSNQSPSSQMQREGTLIPHLPNIIIPIQARAAWKSTFTAH